MSGERNSFDFMTDKDKEWEKTFSLKCDDILGQNDYDYGHYYKGVLDLFNDKDTSEQTKEYFKQQLAITIDDPDSPPHKKAALIEALKTIQLQGTERVSPSESKYNMAEFEKTITGRLDTLVNASEEVRERLVSIYLDNIQDQNIPKIEQEIYSEVLARLQKLVDEGKIKRKPESGH